MAELDSRLPVTVISGFRGVGKTALVNHLIRAWPCPRLAVVLSPASAACLDLRGAAGTVSVHALPERYEKRCWGKGECALRGDLLVAVDRIARRANADWLIVESSGLAPPLPVAQTFAFRDPTDYSLGDVARLDSLVTVLDAVEFLPEYLSGNVLENDPALEEGDDDEATSSHLLALQVEFANVLVLNHADQVSPDALDRLATICHHLNPAARIVPARFAAVPVGRLLDGNGFDLTEARQAAGWLQQLRGAYVADCPKHDVRSFVYRARRPFHPARLWEFIAAEHPEVLECKGYFWLASRWNDLGAWSQCGPVCHVTRLGRWWADVPSELWPDTPAARKRIESNWAEPHGDRRQELAVIGVSIDPAQFRRDLDRCLLTAEEMVQLLVGALTVEDPFPSWADLHRGNCTSRPTMIRNR